MHYVCLATAFVCGLSAWLSVCGFCDSVADGRPSRASLAFAIVNGSLAFINLVHAFGGFK